VTVNLRHRTRLALISAAVSGVLLFGLFVALYVAAKNDLFAQKRAALASALGNFTKEEDAVFDVPEFEEAHPDIAVSVFQPGGKLIKATGHVRLIPREGFGQTEKVLQLGMRFRNQIVIVGLDLTDTDRGLDQLRGILMAIWLPLVLLVGGATWGASVLVFRPLERLSAQALTMSGSNLSDRLVTSDRAEFGAFANNLNQMLDRIEETVRRGERFSTDAAHELRTPLAILRTRLETALLQPREPSEYETTLRRSVEEIGRLTSVTEALLRSARGDAAPANEIDLEPALREAKSRWDERFARGNVRLELCSISTPAKILQDEVSVILDNLLDNALRYALPGSRVLITLGVAKHGTRVSVEDTGPGIPLELGDKVFDRFVRADDSRNRRSGGAGVGLSVCRQIVAGRGGRMFWEQSLSGGAIIGFYLPTEFSVGR